MKTIAVVNQKGGTGKTTAAAHLAHGLALQDFRVLAVDLDAQGNLARLLGHEPGPGARRWLQAQSLNGHAVEARQRLVLLPADKALEPAVTHLLVKHEGRLPEDLVASKLVGLRKFDFVVLDTAPTATQLQAVAMAAADLVVVPAACDYLSQIAVLETVKTMRALGRVSFVILPTFYEQRPRASREALEAYRMHAPAQTLPPIHKAVIVMESARAGKTVFEVATYSRAADEFRTFVWAVRGQLEGG